CPCRATVVRSFSRGDAYAPPRAMCFSDFQPENVERYQSPLSFYFYRTNIVSHRKPISPYYKNAPAQAKQRVG
ncbi:MAG: hypothetical protein MSS99_01185, partial [Bacteroidales bacterium]|nr:hypothetical protein [Bacteroidales bacterium]